MLHRKTSILLTKAPSAFTLSTHLQQPHTPLQQPLCRDRGRITTAGGGALLHTLQSPIVGVDGLCHKYIAFV